MALELQDGGVQTMFDKIGDKNALPPKPFPKPTTPDQEKANLKAYWQWFRENYDARNVMEIVEKTAGTKKISWIDFRVALNEEGETAHLHICPRGQNDIGTFAYNLIKRGNRHGFRIVGTVKSGPDMNVLAIYEK